MDVIPLAIMMATAPTLNHQNARKRCLLRDPRMCIMFSLGHFCFRALAKAEVRATGLKRTVPLSLWHPKGSELLPAPILSKVFFPALGRTEGGDLQTLFRILPALQFHEVLSQPQKTGSISRHFFSVFEVSE